MLVGPLHQKHMGLTQWTQSKFFILHEGMYKGGLRTISIGRDVMSFHSPCCAPGSATKAILQLQIHDQGNTPLKSLNKIDY